MKQPVFVLLALFMLSSCGLKKPLSLPEEDYTYIVNSIDYTSSRH